MILERTDEVLASPHFMDVSQATIEDIASQNALNFTSESQLINACLKWALTHMRARNIGLRTALGKAWKNLRFLCLTPNEFSQGPGKLTIFSVQEKYLLLNKISSLHDESLAIPDIFSQVTEARAKVPVSTPQFTFSENISSMKSIRHCADCTRFVNHEDFCYYCHKRDCSNDALTVSSSGLFASITFQADCDIYLVGLLVYPVTNYKVQVSNETEKKILTQFHATPNPEMRMFLEPKFLSSKCRYNVTITSPKTDISFKARTCQELIGTNKYLKLSAVRTPGGSLLAGMYYRKA